MQAKKGMRVKALADVKGVPYGTTGTVIADLEYTFTVEWDDTALPKSAFDNGTGSRKLEIIEEESNED